MAMTTKEIVEQITTDPQNAPLPGENGVSWLMIRSAIVGRILEIEEDEGVKEQARQARDISDRMTVEKKLNDEVVDMTELSEALGGLEEPVSGLSHRIFIQGLLAYTERLPKDQKNALWGYFMNLGGSARILVVDEALSDEYAFGDKGPLQGVDGELEALEAASSEMEEALSKARGQKINR